MRVLFRCDAGSAFGLGRLSRCRALAAAFSRAGAKSAFAVFGDDPALLGKNNFEINMLSVPRGPDHVLQVAEAADGAQCVVVDSPEVGTLELTRLRDALSPARLIVLDDHADRYITAAAVVNPNLSAYQCHYDIPSDCKTVLGISYALIRPDVAESAMEFVEPPATPRIVVCMGAYDENGQTARILDILDRIRDDFSITAVIGRNAPTVDAVRKYAATMNHATTVEVAPKEVGRIFSGSTIGVCAGGTTALEFACLGIPAAYLVVSEPHEEPTRVLARNGLGIYMGKAKDVGDDVLTEKLHLLIRHQHARDSMTHNGRSLVDGRGADRVLVKLSKFGIIPIEIPQP